MSEVYDGSPMGVLTASGGRGLQAGELGVVTANAGVGKSALLVHVALHELLQDRKVLHVAVSDTVDSARAHYDTVIRAVARTSQTRDWNQALVAAERHRMIHSYLDKGFQLSAVSASMRMLAEVMHFVPAMVVLDGLQDPASHLAELQAFAREHGVRVWCALRSTDMSEAVVDAAALKLSLTPDGRDLALTLDGDDASETVRLDPTTMLVRHSAPAEGEPPVTHAAPDCTLYSGGAKGTEAAFGEAAERAGVRELNFTFEGHKQERSVSRYLLSPRELAAGDVSLVYVSRRLNRSYNAEGGVIRRVLQTLWHMVSRSQQVFVVGAIQEDGTVVGGTGWSVELARMWNKDLWVFDQDQEQWFSWSGDAWVAGEPRIRSLHFCGTGTRYLKASGSAAIHELFERSYS